MMRFYAVFNRKPGLCYQPDQSDVQPDAPDVISTPYHIVFDAILHSLTYRCKVPRKVRTVLFSQFDRQKCPRYKFVVMLLMLATAVSRRHAQLAHQLPVLIGLRADVPN
jgi:hypothetical protein